MEQTNDQLTPATEAAFKAMFGPEKGAELLAVMKATKLFRAPPAQHRGPAAQLVPGAHQAQGPAIEAPVRWATTAATELARASGHGLSIHRPKDQHQ